MSRKYYRTYLRGLKDSPERVPTRFSALLFIHRAFANGMPKSPATHYEIWTPCPPRRKADHTIPQSNMFRKYRQFSSTLPKMAFFAVLEPRPRIRKTSIPDRPMTPSTLACGVTEAQIKRSKNDAVSGRSAFGFWCLFCQGWCEEAKWKWAQKKINFRENFEMK